MGITNKSNNNQPRFGICFDVDGVLARGTIPFQQAVKAFKLISNDKGEIQVPTVFVTNALNRNCDKAAQISNWLGVQVQPSQMIQAQGPLELFTKFHDKFCLVIGQGKIGDIAKELGFKRICTLEEVADAYPLLDIVDHDNRKKIATQGYKEKEFPKIEAIMLLGEPKRWESALQLLVDLLKTDGKPNKAPAAVPDTHLPIIACNTDLQFMDRACMPRYGHGAFLVCLEALYKKVTGRELKYTALVGKPSEITMRYAEHCLSSQAKQLGITEPLQRLYLIGDTPEVDVVGTNLYQRYVDRLHKRLNNQMDVNLELDLVEDADNAGDVSHGQGRGHLKRALSYDKELPQSRNVPLSAALQPQTVGQAQAVLVCTGVYRPTADNESTLTLSEDDEKHYQGHRDFPNNPALYKPSRIVNDVFEAVSLIADIEQFPLDDLYE